MELEGIVKKEGNKFQSIAKAIGKYVLGPIVAAYIALAPIKLPGQDANQTFLEKTKLSAPMAVTLPGDNCASPSASSDGRYVVCTMSNKITGKNDLYVMDMLSKKMNLLVENANNPSFANEDTILYNSPNPDPDDPQHEAKQEKIWEINIHTGEKNCLNRSYTASLRHPTGSDSEWRVVYIVDFFGGNPNVLMHESNADRGERSFNLILSSENPELAPSISRDGKKVAYILRDSQSDVYVLDLTTGSNVNITSSPQNEESPQFDNTGNLVTYIAIDKYGVKQVFAKDISDMKNIKTYQLTHDDGPLLNWHKSTPSFIQYQDKIVTTDYIDEVSTKTNVEDGEDGLITTYKTITNTVPHVTTTTKEQFKILYECQGQIYTQGAALNGSTEVDENVIKTYRTQEEAIKGFIDNSPVIVDPKNPLPQSLDGISDDQIRTMLKAPEVQPYVGVVKMLPNFALKGIVKDFYKKMSSGQEMDNATAERFIKILKE